MIIIKHKGTARLETENLILREFCIGDIETSFENWTSDSKVTKFLRWDSHENIEMTRVVLEYWIRNYENKNFYQWAIVPKDIDEVIGTISVVSLDEKTKKVHIGYCIGSKWWNRGYTSEAFKRIIEFFFEEVEVLRIESQHDPENQNSGAVMKKCGLKYEGTLRKADWNSRGIVDACVYGILREEYFKI